MNWFFIGSQKTKKEKRSRRRTLSFESCEERTAASAVVPLMEVSVTPAPLSSIPAPVIIAPDHKTFRSESGHSMS